MSADLGRVTAVPLREVWPHEAHDFTRWMLANADVLSDVLGIDLELTHNEHRVGDFSLDLLGIDRVTGERVIVENQLEQSDHGHLGQILTYAGGTDPTTIVWCAPSFRDEHRAAIDWINERTDENTRFFAVEVAAVKIDESRPAPMFKLVAQPNDWTKQVHTQRDVTLSPRAAQHREFWSLFLPEIQQKHPDWTRGSKPPATPYLILSGTRRDRWYACVFTGAALRVEIVVSRDARPDGFLGRIEGIANEFGQPIGTEMMRNGKVKFFFDRPEGGSVHDSESWGEYREWFLATMERFRPAFRQVEQDLDREARP